MTSVTAHIADTEATILARYALKGRPAMAIKEQDSWTSVFCGVPGAPVQFFRNLAAAAGVHLFTDRPAMVDACDNLLLVHQIGPQPVTVQLHPNQTWVTIKDQINEKVHASDGGNLVLDGGHGSSHLLGSGA